MSVETYVDRGVSGAWAARLGPMRIERMWFHLSDDGPTTRDARVSVWPWFTASVERDSQRRHQFRFYYGFRRHYVRVEFG
jgi:hypothetical protein